MGSRRIFSVGVQHGICTAYNNYIMLFHKTNTYIAQFKQRSNCLWRVCNEKWQVKHRDESTVFRRLFLSRDTMQDLDSGDR